jgi:sugar phosphate isomerase/epimerase
MIPILRRLFLLLISLSGLSSGAIAAEATARALYTFQNGLRFASLGEEAEFLKGQGYMGVSQVKETGKRLAELVSTYEKAGLRVLSVYLDGSDQAVDPELVKSLADRGAMIELTVLKITPTTPEAVRQTCEMAAKMNIRVALYPHFGFGIATMPQAMKLISKVDHPNLGVMFNLCHFLRGEDLEDIESVIGAAGKRLYAVSVSGADTGGKEWNSLIRPLDLGTFPQERLLTALEKSGFNGTFALQCYGLQGDRRENLTRSMEAWGKLTSSGE